MKLQTFWMLFLSSIAMAVGSFLFGFIPLAINFSPSNLNLVTTYGVGLLLGTAFVIILPEGVETVYSSQIRQSWPKQGQGIPSKQSFPTGFDTGTINSDIGASILFGFAFMLLVDQFSQFSSKNSHMPISISVNDLSRDRELAYTSTSTLGFIIHAAADGIAMGAAFSAEESPGMGWIVFFAILIHKAPAAFGLSTYLLAKRLSKYQIMKQLGLFSVAAPAAAVMTFLAISMLDTDDSFILSYRTGLVLLFSTGTFLYVAAVHILPEIYKREQHSSSVRHDNHSDEKNLSLSQILLLGLGMLTPIVLTRH